MWLISHSLLIVTSIWVLARHHSSFATASAASATPTALDELLGIRPLLCWGQHGCSWRSTTTGGWIVLLSDDWKAESPHRRFGKPKHRIVGWNPKRTPLRRRRASGVQWSRWVFQADHGEGHVDDHVGILSAPPPAPWNSKENTGDSGTGRKCRAERPLRSLRTNQGMWQWGQWWRRTPRSRWERQSRKEPAEDATAPVGAPTSEPVGAWQGSTTDASTTSKAMHRLAALASTAATPIFQVANLAWNINKKSNVHRSKATNPFTPR